RSRRHTRFSRDWSSDVCSSDLHAMHVGDGGQHLGGAGADALADGAAFGEHVAAGGKLVALDDLAGAGLHGLRTGLQDVQLAVVRSEERRVGKTLKAEGLACQLR